MSTDRRHVSWLLWLWWVAAGVIGGGIGGMVAAPLERAANSYTYLIVAAVVTAVLQWLLLRRYIRGAAWWVLATVAGWPVGFQATTAIGFSVVSVLGLDLTPGTSGAPTTILFWFPAGAIVGLVQWLVLHQRVARAGWWILVCAVGWTLFGPVLRDVGAALAGIITGALSGVIGALVVIVVLRRRLSQSGLWVLAAVVGWAASWIAALITSDAAWQLERDALSGVIEGAALSALPGVALVWLLRRPITANPDVPPFEWRFWLRWVLVSAGSAALIGLVLGTIIRVMGETLEEDLLLGQGDFLLVLFTAVGIAVGIIQWLLLRQRLPLAGLWGLGSAIGFLVLGFLWLIQLGGSSALGSLASGLVAGTIQWIPLRRKVPWASRWILMSTLGVALVGPITILAGTLLGTLATLSGAAIVSYAVLGTIIAAGITSVTGTALIWLLRQPRPTPGEQERA